MPDPQNRYFDPDPQVGNIAREIYEGAKNLPLVCPHGHVDAGLFADPDYHFPNPTELLIKPDHYLYRMLQSQGITPDRLGVPRVDNGDSETDARQIWLLFARNFYLFRGTPSGMWLADELKEIFGIQEKLDEASAMRIYDQVQDRIKASDFQPRKLYQHFNIEVLCTTDPATSALDNHAAIQNSDWQGRVLPTFRPDAVIDIARKDWLKNIRDLETVSGMEVKDFRSFTQALEKQREFFKSLGAVATDHGCLSADTMQLSPAKGDALFQRALKSKIDGNDATLFRAGMLFEMARMSTEDGLVMQLHAGSFRDHDALTLERYGQDAGADIPIPVEFTRPLKPLLDAFGNHPNFTLILFTLDESTYSRELGPLAGHYPAVKLGPPWWFHHSWDGIHRYLDNIIESAGSYNTAGFNDDCHTLLSIPSRHDLWRRACANWLAGLTAKQVIDRRDATEMMRALCYDLAKKSYRL